MNKYEKVALQCAKDDIKKGCDFTSLKKSNRAYAAIFKEERFPFAKAVDFKNWNKGLVW